MKYLLLLALCVFCGFRAFVQKPDSGLKTESQHLVISAPKYLGNGEYLFIGDSQEFTIEMEQFLRSHNLQGIDVKKRVNGYYVTFTQKD